MSLKCFSESLTAVSSDAALLSEIPACSKPADGYGILINLTDENRWQPFATWVIKLLCKCITEGTLYVEGLIHVSFVSAACNLLCYGDANLHMVGSFGPQVWFVISKLLVYIFKYKFLHRCLVNFIFLFGLFSFFLWMLSIWFWFPNIFFWKACFDFACIIGAVTNYEIIPSEKLILSISTILSEDKKGIPVFRYVFSNFY